LRRLPRIKPGERPDPQDLWEYLQDLRYLFRIQLRGGLEIAAMLLMLLGTQRYILFNVIAGAMAVPTDLKEVARIF
jgi:hypothetical protein